MKALILILALTISTIVLAKQEPESIPYPFHDNQKDGQNEMMPIHDGIAALELRIQMIKRAQKNIEVEYFIFNTDIAGKILTRELVEAAKRGVKVRILIDKSLPIFQFDEYYAQAVAEYGVEVKYYNTAPLYRISTVQFRNHRKLLTVDDIEAITGGRNIGDDYFDLSEKFNFYDRDIYVKGNIVKTMRESFDKFFEHEISVSPKRPKQNKKIGKKKHLKKIAKAKAFLEETEKEKEVRERSRINGQKIIDQSKLYSCPETTFASDAPGANFIERLDKDYKDEYRFLRRVLRDRVINVNKRILISSPYLINNKRSKELMYNLLEKNIQIDVYTNSLASTDAVYVAANLYKDIDYWSSLGINIYLHDSKWFEEGEATPESIQKAKWGTHDKTQIYESSTHTEVMIGTYNIEVLSNFLCKFISHS